MKPQIGKYLFVYLLVVSFSFKSRFSSGNSSYCENVYSSIHVYSYITGYISAVLAKVQKDDHEEGTVIKWMELILT